MISTGKFIGYEFHHTGWFRVFRFGSAVEVWFGPRWIMLDWGKK